MHSPLLADVMQALKHFMKQFDMSPYTAREEIEYCFEEERSRSDIFQEVTSGLNVSYPAALPEGAMMDFKTLLRKHQALLAENKALKEENLSLKARLGLAEPLESRSSPEGVQRDASQAERSFHLNAEADPTEKIRLFMSLFKGRDDLYAKR